MQNEISTEFRLEVLERGLASGIWSKSQAKTDFQHPAQGLLMYFTGQEVKNLMDKLVEAFPGPEMLLEMMTPTLAKQSKRHSAVNKTDAVFKWGVSGVKEMENLNCRIRFLEEWNYFDFRKDRWKWMGWLALIPAFKKRFNNRIVHLHL